MNFDKLYQVMREFNNISLNMMHGIMWVDLYSSTIVNYKLDFYSVYGDEIKQLIF